MEGRRVLACPHLGQFRLAICNVCRMFGRIQISRRIFPGWHTVACLCEAGAGSALEDGGDGGSGVRAVVAGDRFRRRLGWLVMEINSRGQHGKGQNRDGQDYFGSHAFKGAGLRVEEMGSAF